LYSGNGNLYYSQGGSEKLLQLKASFLNHKKATNGSSFCD
jgi:hypothetical protein